MDGYFDVRVPVEGVDGVNGRRSIPGTDARHNTEDISLAPCLKGVCNGECVDIIGLQNGNVSTVAGNKM